MRLVKYSKIREFKTTVSNIRSWARYHNKPAPKVVFKGTVKANGTNICLYYTPEEGLVAGRRKALLNSSDIDQYGLIKYMGDNIEYLTSMMSELYSKHCNPQDQLMLYGEWAGGDICKSSLSSLEKNFYIFELVKISQEDVKTRLPLSIESSSVHNLYNINDFGDWTITIDFGAADLSTNTLAEITSGVEERCPIADFFGVEGVGEGVVWSAEVAGKRHIFKVKGKKHSNTRVRGLAKVDEETIRSSYEFVEFTCTPNRIDQGIVETNSTTMEDTGDLISWVIRDIMSEEEDLLVESGLEWKDVNRKIANKVREYWCNPMNRSDNNRRNV